MKRDSTTTGDLTGIISQSVDTPVDFSFKELGQWFRLRRSLFFVCLGTVPLVALLVTALLPANYRSSAELLIRRGSNNAAYFQGVASDHATLSGSSAAEIVKSAPVCGQMIRDLNVQPADIARPAYKRLLGYPMSALGWIIPEEGAPKTDDERVAMMAREMKEAIQSETLHSDTSLPVEEDEILQVELKSTNRERVAEMVNHLCEAFIEQSRQHDAQDADEAVRVLGQQVDQARQEIADLRRSLGEDIPDAVAESPAMVAGPPQGEANQGRTLGFQLAQQVADLQLKLVQLRQVFKDSAPEVIRAKDDVEHARAALLKQQALESAQSNLGQLVERQRQAQTAAELYQSGLSDISFVERGITPMSGRALRWGLPLGAGLLLGGMLGFGLVIVLGLLDTRVRTSRDLEKITGGTEVAEIAGLTAGAVRLDSFTLPISGPVRAALLQTIRTVSAGEGLVLAVASPGRGEGKSFLALQLARLLASPSQAKVLLIDGNLAGPDLSAALRGQAAEGFVEALGGERSILSLADRTEAENLFFLPAGESARFQEMGFFEERLGALMAEVRRVYPVVVVEAGGLCSSREGVAFVRNADHVVLAVRAGVTEKEDLRRAMRELEAVGRAPLGIVFLAMEDQDADGLAWLFAARKRGGGVSPK
jgi:Mrp family chromosome partitioning ATPase